MTPPVRSNAADFDDVQLLLGFTDQSTGARIERTLNLFDDFDGVVFDPTPSVMPDGVNFMVVDAHD